MKTWITLFAIMISFSSLAKNCFKYNVCEGDTVYVSLLGIQKAKIKTLQRNRYFEDFYLSHSKIKAPVSPSFVFKTKGSSLIGKIHRDNRTEKLYRIIAVNLKGDDYFIGRNTKTKELETFVSNYNSPLAPLRSPRPKAIIPTWSMNSKADQQGIVQLASSISNRTKNFSLKYTCDTLSNNPILSIESKELTSQSSITNPELNITLTVFSRDNETEINSYSSSDYRLNHEGHITKSTPLPKDTLEAFKSGSTVEVEIQVMDQNKELTFHSATTLSLRNSKPILTKMLNICFGNL